MAAPRRVPDAFYHASLWLGVGLALILFGWGFAERAGDRPPWSAWISAPAALLPFALLVWLRDSGRIEFIDTERVERRMNAVPVRVPGPWRLPFAIVTTIVGFVWEEYAEDRVVDRAGDILAGLPHLERGAWALIALGICGAVYETVRVVRNAPPAPEEPTPPGTEGPPEA